MACLDRQVLPLVADDDYSRDSFLARDFQQLVDRLRCQQAALVDDPQLGFVGWHYWIADETGDGACVDSGLSQFVDGGGLHTESEHSVALALGVLLDCSAGGGL